MHNIKRKDFMWMTPEGMIMCGTNGSQLWDIGFITQALVETGLANEDQNKESLLKAFDWLDQAQILEEPKHLKSAYRQKTKGAWGFRLVIFLQTKGTSLIRLYSTKEQGYTVTDCTGEGLKAVMYLQSYLK